VPQPSFRDLPPTPLKGGSSSFFNSNIFKYEYEPSFRGGGGQKCDEIERKRGKK